ncbi:MAG: hypothetical protein A3G33_06720 [Omnitrophica bacterium RIFCSPLOWO2_12_FULL_44_17]|uniref:HTH cro/C1-type domain-containing protein n=1 Tax=Candidatus Danuiimicrobium aquiferis TaxID=1801832 RepID=A0A1G1L2J1_9BACT|nr:MAG: hypothetical protein A3B72_03300 [Omnitrophica bacterium RIFCSPHIGHO2_02_FULL_45_28]OGW99375.1 MAG: hypothetical protein A3G33_06720 [Omnitrophica bacterium RIFCSPLOWO2_12_FULL_44_17]OGX02051.1 MAG: hypothetical protein A3J12_01395 [Omnitrophica bacterium RIFCSPLOWO2_02_FULL_44_11]
MYEKILKHFKAAYPGFPAKPSINLGLGIKQIRLRMGMTQDELAGQAKMKPTALKTLENGYAQFTKASNLERLASALHTKICDIVNEAREWFASNFFVLKLEDPEQPSPRQRKWRAEKWFKAKWHSFDGFDACLLTSPAEGPAHFHFAAIDIHPGHALKHLHRKSHTLTQIAGFVERGSLKIIYTGKEASTLSGNQGFILRGDKTHQFINEDHDNKLRIYLAFLFPLQKSIKKKPRKNLSRESFSVGRAIESLRLLYSDSPARPLSFSRLAELTGLDAKSLKYLSKTNHPGQVVYWDKIEVITHALHIPISRFIELAEGKDDGYIKIATAHDRALIDYRHYLGVRIKSILFPSSSNQFHFSELYIEPRGGIRRASWRRTDNAMMLAYVEDGELLVEVGKNRKTLLSAGESVYFDGSLGYIFTNSGAKPTKILFVTHPAIIF